MITDVLKTNPSMIHNIVIACSLLLHVSQEMKIDSLLEGGRKQEAEVRQKKPYLDCGMCQIMLKYNNKLLN